MDLTLSLRMGQGGEWFMQDYLLLTDRTPLLLADGAILLLASGNVVVSTPTITPKTSTISTTDDITVSTTTEGASIYYTIDGSDPDETDTLYSSPITLSESLSTTVKAKAYKSGLTESSIASETYTMEQVETPTISLASGTIESSDEITLACATASASIYYTTDGNDPTTESTEYSSPFTLSASASTTLKVRAYATGKITSSIASETYTVTTYEDVTLNPYDKHVELTISSGNMVVVKNSGGNQNRTVRATKGITSGKYYFEVKKTAASNDGGVGVCNSFVPVTDYLSFGPDAAGTRGIGYYWNGGLNINGANTASWGSSWTSLNDVVGVAIDADTGKVWFRFNGVWQGSGDPENGTNPAGTIDGELFPAISIYYNDGSKYYQFIADLGSFRDAPPTGFSAWPQRKLPFTNQQMNKADSGSYIILDAYNSGAKNSSGSPSWHSSRAITGAATGKKYFEMYIDTIGGGASNMLIGVGNSSAEITSYFPVNANGWGKFATGDSIMHNNVAAGSAGDAGAGDTIGCAVDLDAHTIYFSVNGVWTPGDPVAGTGAAYSNLSGTLYPMIALTDTYCLAHVLFQASQWNYSAPAGYGEW